MRFSKHQLLALILGAGMATTLPAQVARRGNGKQLDSTRVAARAAKRGDTTLVAQRLARLGVDTARVSEMMARRAEGNSPAGQLLAQREKLGLTDDQVARLEALKAAFATKEMAPAEMQKLREELAVASRGEANLSAARIALDKINEAQNAVVLARLEAHNQARAVLNGDQQATFDASEAKRPAMLGGAFGGGALGAGGARGGPGGRGGAAGRGRGGPPPASSIPPQ